MPWFVADFVPSKLRAVNEDQGAQEAAIIMNKTLPIPHVLTAKSSVPQGLMWMGSSISVGPMKLNHPHAHSKVTDPSSRDETHASQFPEALHV